MPTDPHFWCCQQGSNVCQRPASQRGGHPDLHLHICFAKHKTLEVWKAPMCTKWDVITCTEGAACACHLGGRTQNSPSVQNSSCITTGDVLLVSSILIRRKLHFSAFHEQTGYQKVKKEPHTLSSFRKMLILSMSLLGVCRHEDQGSAWSELLEGQCCWSLPCTEVSWFGSEGFQRSFQTFLFPAVSGFFSYLGVSLPMVMCLQLMLR